MTKLKSVILMMLVGVLMLVTLVGCGGTKTKPTNATVQDTVELKNAIVEGNFTADEKKKIVELTDKYIKLATDFDYTKTTFEQTTEFFKYTTAEVKSQFPEDILKKMYEGQIKTKQSIKVESITFNKIAKDTNGNITVDFSTKIKVNSHTNEKLNGKTFDDVKSMFVFDKDFNISAFTMAGLLEQ